MSKRPAETMDSRIAAAFANDATSETSVVLSPKLKPPPALPKPQRRGGAGTGA